MLNCRIFPCCREYEALVGLVGWWRVLVLGLVAVFAEHACNCLCDWVIVVMRDFNRDEAVSRECICLRVDFLDV
jgi:hypothetical protein